MDRRRGVSREAARRGNLLRPRVSSDRLMVNDIGLGEPVGCDRCHATEVPGRRRASKSREESHTAPVG